MIIVTISLLIFWFYFCMHLYEIDYWDRKERKTLKDRVKMPIWVHLIAIAILCIPFLNVLAFIFMLIMYNACMKEELDVKFKDNFFCKIGEFFTKEV